MSKLDSNLSHLPQTATETLEAYKALGEKVETIAGAYEQALVRLRDARRLLGERDEAHEKDVETLKIVNGTCGQLNEDLGNAYKELKEAQELSGERLNAIDELRVILTEVHTERDAAIAKAEEWRKMHSEALGETAKARDDLSIALRALEASRVSEAAWKGMYEASRVSLDEAHATLGKLPKTRVALPGDEPEFLPGDLARSSPSDTRPSSDFWPPVDRVDGDTVWLRYTQGEVNCKRAMIVRKPVIAGDYVRVWRGPAQGIRGRVEGYGDGGAIRINGTDWVNLTDVVAVKP